MEKQAILILYNDGNIAIPEAKTFGDVRKCFAAIRIASERFEEQMLALPLPITTNKPEEPNAL